MAEHADDPKHLDLGKLLDSKQVNFELKSPETPDEIRSRLKLAEIEAEHKLRTQEAEDTHKRRISLIVHIFVMAIVAVAFLASAYIAVAGDPKTGLPDKAMGIITGRGGLHDGQGEQVGIAPVREERYVSFQTDRPSALGPQPDRFFFLAFASWCAIAFYEGHPRSPNYGWPLLHGSIAWVLFRSMDGPFCMFGIVVRPVFRGSAQRLTPNMLRSRKERQSNCGRAHGATTSAYRDPRR